MENLSMTWRLSVVLRFYGSTVLRRGGSFYGSAVLRRGGAQDFDEEKEELNED